MQRLIVLLGYIVITLCMSFSANAIQYSGANITIAGADYTNISGIWDGITRGWEIEDDKILTWWDQQWVEYEVVLTKGNWLIGLNVINHSNPGDAGLGSDPTWYPQFEISNSYTHDVVKVPASDTEVNHGFFIFEVPLDGRYTFRFTWLNDQTWGTLPDGRPILDANIKIISVFFDQIASSSMLQNPENGHTYQRIDNEMTWHGAKAYCECFKGHLVTISSESENQFVCDILSSSWIGATDEATEGLWEWVTGEPWVFSSWSPGEPNNCCPPWICGGSECTPEHYLTYWGDPYEDEWNDVPNGFRPFICEWDEPLVLNVNIDIKPGSYPNCFNKNEHGVIPVAIFGGPDFDVRNILVDQMTLQGVSVKIAGKSNKYLSHYEYVNEDTYLDLIVQFEDNNAWVDSGSDFAVLTGVLEDGTNFEGSDTICIVP